VPSDPALKVCPGLPVMSPEPGTPRRSRQVAQFCGFHSSNSLHDPSSTYFLICEEGRGGKHQVLEQRLVGVQVLCRGGDAHRGR